MKLACPECRSRIAAAAADLASQQARCAACGHSFDFAGAFRQITQTRPALPTDEESALADSLMAIFVKGAWELSEVVTQLNRLGPPPVSGGVWTDENLAATLARLDLYEGR